MKLTTRFLFTLLVLALVGLGAASAAAQQYNDVGKPAPPPPIVASPRFESDVDNGDGTWTFSQLITAGATPPHYEGPFYGPSDCATTAGFGFYSWFDQDYGWRHNFPHWNTANLTIQSATLRIVAWDVDSEPFHGPDGEYDGIHVDGTLLDPGYLQGTDGTWSVTMFNVPMSSILDDGLINVLMNIDMNHTACTWATTLDSSLIQIVYRPDNPNHAPHAPWLAISPALPRCPRDWEDHVVTVVGPVPADPDGDPVTYQYRWFVDAGTGSFIDDEFAGRGDHLGNVVPGADTQAGDIWRVQVTPVDSHGAIGDFGTATFNRVESLATGNSRPTWGQLKAMYR